MYIATSQSCNGISGEPSSSSPVNWRCGTLRGKQMAKAPAYAFILPNLEQYPADFRRFLERDIIEISTLRRLENSGHLNWWCQHDNNQRLWPLVTTGDGNCLLHAASLGIWGVHDRQLNLRNTLHDVLKFGSRRHAIYRRWRWHESKSNLQSELVLSEEEWRREWNAVLELASPTPRQNPSDNDGSLSTEETSSSQQQDQVYESLECVHVFALAHILQRPIIVVADTILRNAKGEELAPIPFGGIYLPLECPPEQCHRSPLLLCFDQSHFSALVAMRQSIATTLQVIPITDKNRNLLPVHFSVDPGPDFTWWRDSDDFRIAADIESIQSDDRRLELISRYMDIVRMDLRRGSVRKTVPMPFANGGGTFNGATPSVPNKLLTLAAGGSDFGAGRSAWPSSCLNAATVECTHRQSSGGITSRVGTSSILKEIRQHFRRLGRKSSRQSRCSLPMTTETDQHHQQQQHHNGHHSSSAAPFSSVELLQANHVLTVLLHNYAHQYIDSMLSLYIANARERFECAKLMPQSSLPKNRLSRSFSTASVLLTCLSTHCQRVAHPSNNFLCDACFEAQKRELTRTLIGDSGAAVAAAEAAASSCTTAAAPAHHSPASSVVAVAVIDGTAEAELLAPPLPPKKSIVQQHRHQPSYDSGLHPLMSPVTGEYCVNCQLSA
uniref:ubiquitinyl hydrolase 1 n=1 Tax=Globodera rostochiensis TaxID=31243 RepID=A0A914HEC3_GLORO